MTNKSEIYERGFKEITRKIKGLNVHDRMKMICKILKEEIPYYFWIGCYFPKGEFLELGPSMGPPACNRIAATGVCGRAVKERRPIIVPDVKMFPGHIVCDPRSKSEIALPIFDSGGNVIAVLDVDSEELRSFDETDREWLEKILGYVFLHHENDSEDNANE
ncbi:TPA: GAF domain-containing protein [Candidatus Bathyarchaeota archaeon]|nr:GAF domain-containing protein [Candidatus Bathyarchaeota archaeon]